MAHIVQSVLCSYEHKDLIFRICKLKHYRRHLTRAHKQIVLDKRKEFTTSLTSFDELIDILWSLKIYPSLVSKNRIRFYFLYEQNSECGVTLKSLGDIIILIALHREGDVQDNAKAIVDKVVCFK